MQNAVPIMITLAAFPPFFNSKTWKMSSRNGMNATNSTEGEMNNPINVTAANKKQIKYHGPLRAILFVINDIVHLLTKFVFDNGYTSMNVNIKNATVVLPKAPAKVPKNPNTGMIPSASSVIMLGQSMDIPIHIINDPKNTPSTAIASADNPPIPGISLDPMITARASMKNTFAFVSLFPMFFLLLSSFKSFVFDRFYHICPLAICKIFIYYIVDSLIL